MLEDLGLDQSVVSSAKITSTEMKVIYNMI